MRAWPRLRSSSSGFIKENSKRIGVFWSPELEAWFVGMKDYRTTPAAMKALGENVLAVISGGSGELASFLTDASPIPAYVLPNSELLEDAGLTILYRNVSEDEMDVIQAELDEDFLWELSQMLELADESILPENMQEMIDSEGGAPGEIDWAFDVIRIEYGLPGAPLLSHWRPALAAATSELDDILKKAFITALHPSYTEFRTKLKEQEIGRLPDSIDDFMSAVEYI